MLFNRKQGTQTIGKQNFCGGFRIPKRPLNLQSCFKTERVISQPRPATGRRLATRPKVIQNGIYFGSFGLGTIPGSGYGQGRPKKIKVKCPTNELCANQQQEFFHNTIVVSYKLQRLKVVPVTVYPDFRSFNTVSHISNPFRTVEKKKSQPTALLEYDQQFKENSPPQSKNASIQSRIVLASSDKLITQFFQRKIKTKSKQLRPFTAYQPPNKQIINHMDTYNTVVNNKASSKQLLIPAVLECLQQEQHDQNKSQQKRRKSYEYLMTDYELNQSIDELQCVASNLLSKALNESRAQKQIQGSQEDRIKFKTELRIGLRRPQTSTANRILSPKTVASPLKQPDEYENSLDRFAIGEIIGKGSYAIVRIARDKITTKQVAIKSYEKSNLTDLQKRNNVKREIQILNRISHPNIIKLLMTVNNPNSINLIMEYPGSLSMRNYLKQFENRQLNEDDARQKFKQVVQAIDHCHTQNVIHRDIKLENILIDSQQNIKVIDFGFAVAVHEGSKLNIFCGTPSYMAPEIVSKQEYLGKPVDVWSLGVLLYVFLNGQFPFRGKEDGELYKAIKSGIFRMKVNISLTAQRLMHNMLRVKQTERFTTMDILRDPWFQ